MNLEAEYRRYIEEATGSAPLMEEVQSEIAGRLPLYLRSYYRLAKTQLFGRQSLLAIQNPDTDTATPSEYARHHNTLRASFDNEVVLVLHQVSSYGRQQLVRLGIPFVVPHRQAFLPPMMVDLHERFPRTTSQPVSRLAAAAQVVLLRHLLGRHVEGVSLRELAGELGYSAMTLSTVRIELESLGLCKSIQKGRSTQIEFPAPMRELWERAESHLLSPVKARHWVRFIRKDERNLHAGLTALAAASMISDDELPTCSMKSSDYRAQLERGDIARCHGAEDAQARVECWAYDPHLLSDGSAVDRLSLYLSLRGTHDERIEKALTALLEGMPW
ncbi:MAG: hypothetical protein WCL49_06065 [bacterium]